MSTLKNTAKHLIQIHSPAQLKSAIQAKPEGARYIAVSKDKLASIFYKNIRGVFYMDSMSGQGWEIVRQKSEKELINSLRCISFMLTEVDILDECLSKYPEEPAGSGIEVLKSRVNTQIAKVALRRDHENEPQGYWQGQYDAFEAVQYLMRECV